MKIYRSILTLCCIVIAIVARAQDSSVLSEGDWYKFAITEDNVYKIDGASLASYGIPLENLDPTKIRIFGHTQGMLPQANDAQRPVDLYELAIQVAAGSDNKFDTQDYILFYGEGPDTFTFDSLSQQFTYEQNIYSDTAYYFLNVNLAQGKRIQKSAEIIGSYPEISNFWDGFVHEVDAYNILKSGREWYGEIFDLDLNQSFETDIVDLVPGSNLAIQSAVMAASPQASKFSLTTNGSQIGEQLMNPIPSSTYAIKGNVNIDTFSITAPDLNGELLQIEYNFEKQTGKGHLDYFVLSTKRPLIFRNEPLLLFPADLDVAPTTTIRIKEAKTNLNIWDVSSHYDVSLVPATLIGEDITANIKSDSTKALIIFNEQNELESPLFLKQIENQNLRALSAPDLLIVTAEIYFGAAQQIASLRASEGLSVAIATDQQVYNEFSAGKADITAIRDFARHLYQKGGLKYLLLIGKGTYDNKNILMDNRSFLPSYQSRNSLNPLATYGSDDYLGFMEDQEGAWPENFSYDGTVDIGVGRLPVKSVIEAGYVVDKLYKYNSDTALGNWRKDVYFVAEDSDFNIHQRDAERLATLIDTTYSTFNTNKIYLDAYPIDINPGSKRAPQVNEAIMEAIEKGAFILNYTGHGNEVQWANARVFDKQMIQALTNNERYPLFVTATCEFGRHDDTKVVSGAEELLIRNNAGAIAMITTCRPVFSSSNYSLNQAFYQQVFETPNGVYQALGDIFRYTKNNSVNGVLNRNFSLLGDPSMKLSYPMVNISIDSLNHLPLNGTDTIQALAKTIFSGAVRNSSGQIIPDYNGTLNATFFDREVLKLTLGQTASKFAYTERDNVLYKGSVSISNGVFQIEFVLPKDISYSPEPGKLSLYSLNKENLMDASGANLSINIGGTATNIETDTTPPEIALFMGDTTYIPGSTVSTNTILLAKLFDKSGINISSTQVGHSIEAILDDTLSWTLNNSFSYQTDSYTTGWVSYPLNDLAPGAHSLVFKAWDSYNNPAQKTLTFHVGEKGGISIDAFNTYPNPMTNLTTLYINQSSTGDDLDITFEVIGSSGEQIFTETRSYFSASGVINDWTWDGRNHTGGKLNEGIYIIGIKLRSNKSGAVNQRFNRLFITN